MDDIFCHLRQQPAPRRPGLRSSTIHADNNPTKAFNNCLNAVHERVQFTCEEETLDERGYGTLAFLDVRLTRLPNGRISTQVYRKPTNTNLIIKPQSCQPPETTTATFKGELCRAYRFSSTPEILQAEIANITNIRGRPKAVFVFGTEDRRLMKPSVPKITEDCRRPKTEG